MQVCPQKDLCPWNPARLIQFKGRIMVRSGRKGKRKMAFIKNIDHEKVLNLASQITAAPGQIVSKTLAQNKAVSLTLFAFSKGEEISTHDSTGDAMVHVIEGVGQFTVDGVEHICKAGDVLVMPAKKPHAVFAKEDFKMLLTVIFPLD